MSEQVEKLGTVFRVAYLPAIPHTLKELIEKYVSPAMTHPDFDSIQYAVDMIEGDIEEDLLNERDKKFIKLLNKEGIDYVEF